MLKLENISKYYYSSTNVTCALRKINLEFKLGEFVSITGESGSGKTTLLNVISGLDTYEDGEMYYGDKTTSYFDDEDWENYRKNEIAFIFQNYNLIDSFTVLENVAVAYIIDGYDYKTAKKKAKEVLKLVGLDKDYRKKAIKLSGGQKQRLSIARALAKETNIIVADEPTGNLDVENGVLILDLLKKLSKDKLVIVVTHNQAQIEPYATRKVRLHDGEIVLDEKVEEVDNDFNLIDKSNNETKQSKTMFDFTFLNIKSQPKKSFLLSFLILIMVLATFIFYGNFKMNMDADRTKKLDDEIFTNFDDTRLLVKTSNNKAITQELLDKAKINHVKSVEVFDYITDINYYRPDDYKIKYSGGFVEGGAFPGDITFVDTSSFILTNQNRFMRSSCDITIDDLIAGKLPTGSFEMVVYSEDTSIIGKKETVFFRNDRYWGDDSWYQYEMTIVGILKEPSEQTYFSDDICKIMSFTQFQNSNIFRIGYQNRRNSRVQYLTYNRIAVDPKIDKFDLSFPANDLNILWNANYFPHENVYLSTKYHKQYYYNQELNLIYSHKIADGVLGVSEELFNHLYNMIPASCQFALFIEDYAYIDEVQSELAKLGFESISCYRASTNGYDDDKVIIRLVNLGVSVVGLIVVSIVIIVLAYTILKVKKGDYVIFKMIGLTNKLSKKINYLEVLFYGLLANILTIIIIIIVKNYVDNDLIKEMFKYIRFYDYIIILMITTIGMIILGNKFGKFISTRVKITVLKEE